LTSLSYDDINFRKQYRPPWTFNCILQKYRFLFLFIPHTLSVHFSLHGRADIFWFSINICRCSYRRHTVASLKLLLRHYIEANHITGLTPTHFCECLKQGPRFPTFVIFFMFNEMKWEVVGRFVDIGRIVDHHCLNFLYNIIIPLLLQQIWSQNIIFNLYEQWHLTRKQKVDIWFTM
jgi:hypothetical protein